MRDQILTLDISQRILQLHQLNEEIMLRVEAGRVHRALEVEREPLLNAAETDALRDIEEKRQVEHDRRRHDAVAAQVILGTWLEKQTTSQKTLLTGEDKTLYNDKKNE